MTLVLPHTLRVLQHILVFKNRADMPGVFVDGGDLSNQIKICGLMPGVFVDGYAATVSQVGLPHTLRVLLDH